MSHPDPILVLGATGKTGRRVAARLASAGVPVRAGSRRADPPFDWGDPAGWPRALSDVRAVYISFFPDLAMPGSADAIARLVGDAGAAGVRRLVLLSGRGEAQAALCEQVVLGAAAEATVVRAGWFAQNFSEGHLLAPVLSGTIHLPADGVAEPFVDAEDIAEVATTALLGDGHDGRVYEVTGPRSLTFAQAAAEIAAAAGRPVAYVPVTRARYRDLLIGEGAPPELAELLCDLFAEVLDGRNAEPADGVERALGRPARDFAEYARAAAHSGVWDAAR